MVVRNPLTLMNCVRNESPLKLKIKKEDCYGITAQLLLWSEVTLPPKRGCPLLRPKQ